MPRFSITIKALLQLSPQRLLPYLGYQLKLRSGYLRMHTAEDDPYAGLYLKLNTDCFALPDRCVLSSILGEEGRSRLLAEAAEIIHGQARLFGAKPVPLQLIPPYPLQHWTVYESGKPIPGFEDPKILWEPARFGWAFVLGRAYHLTGDEGYSQALWSYIEAFLASNPPFLGANWMSAQEVGLRLIAFAFAACVCVSSPHSTPARMNILTQAIARHASRIPSTLAYARAQNNNHLLSEAAALYTAALILPEHPSANHWYKLGSIWLERGIRAQFDPGGAYIQHSTNYHRLALQLALWVNRLQEREPSPVFSTSTRERLASATRWLLAITDRQSGCLPNLGANDGAYIHPLSTCPYQDYRPVLQASARAFLSSQPFTAGAWDEMSLWYGYPPDGSPLSDVQHLPAHPQPGPMVMHNPINHSWAYLRTAHFSSRPGHADQLHLDLWWNGMNLAQDAGTYLYNAPPPWDNSLTHTAVHNTLTINQQEQMKRAGRFLYLDWAQTSLITHTVDPTHSYETLVARHNGYRGMGLLHERRVTTWKDGKWSIEDHLLPQKAHFQPRAHSVRLHWLLPDGQYELSDSPDGFIIRLLSPFGWVTLSLSRSPSTTPGYIQIARAGELIAGEGAISPTWGWTSPTYGDKIPALSVGFIIKSIPPTVITSQWILPTQKD